VWLSIKCKGGAARLSLPDYVANFSWTQTDKSGTWSPAAGTLNATDGTWLVTGLGIKFYQNISVSNDVLTTLAYGKGADNVHTSQPANLRLLNLSFRQLYCNFVEWR
jgi:hypothetical protein